MPMMFGFSRHRRETLEAELRRFASEAPAFGALRAYEIGDLAHGRVGPGSELELIIVQETDEPFHRRADFWVGHLRPRVGTRLLIYTPDEFEALEELDRLLLAALLLGEPVV